MRFVRDLQGVSQSTVAKGAGISQQSVNSLENGKASLSLETLKRIAATLKVNPLFISGESSNPFKSNDLIKFRLPESILDGIDYSIIYYIAEHNKYLNLIYFISSSPVYSKFFSKTVFAYPVLAIGIKDADNNIFLIKRKTQYPLVGERELIIKLSGLAEQGKLKIVTNHHLLLAGQEVKFKDFSVTKENIAEYFENLDDMIINTNEENELIKYIRKNNIDPQIIIDYLKGNVSSVT